MEHQDLLLPYTLKFYYFEAIVFHTRKICHIEDITVATRSISLRYEKSGRSLERELAESPRGITKKGTTSLLTHISDCYIIPVELWNVRIFENVRILKKKMTANTTYEPNNKF